MRARRPSPQTTLVLDALATGPHHGYALMQATGLSSGSIYPILVRLEQRGVVESEWEAEQPQGRPRRRTYRLNR